MFIDALLIVLFIIGGVGTVISAGQWNVIRIPIYLSATCVSLLERFSFEGVTIILLLLKYNKLCYSQYNYYVKIKAEESLTFQEVRIHTGTTIECLIVHCYHNVFLYKNNCTYPRLYTYTILSKATYYNILYNLSK